MEIANAKYTVHHYCVHSRQLVHLLTGPLELKKKKYNDESNLDNTTQNQSINSNPNTKQPNKWPSVKKKQNSQIRSTCGP